MNQDLINRLALIELEIDALTIKQKNELLPKIEALATIFRQYVSTTFKEDVFRDFINPSTAFTLAEIKANEEIAWKTGKKT